MRIVLLCFISAILIGSCSSPKQQESEKNKKESPTSSQTNSDSGPNNFTSFDTLEIIKIDSVIQEIHTEISTLGPPEKVPYIVYDPTDTIYYWTMFDEAARISLEINMPDGIVWPVYYIYKGEIVFIRYRYFLDAPPNSIAKESLVYLKDSKVVYCKERSQPMVDGGMPAGLKQKPFDISSRTITEIKKDYSEHWQIILEHMKENNSLPEFLEKFKSQ